MTKSLLAFLCAVTLPLPASFAQSPTPVPPARKDSPTVAAPAKSADKPADENYVLTLSPAGKGEEGFAVIVTPPQTFNLSRPGLTFNGSLARTESGAYRLDYLLETNAERGGTIHTGASVILSPGEPVQLVKNGEQFYNLRLDHYPPPEAAKPEPPRPIAH